MEIQWRVPLCIGVNEGKQSVMPSPVSLALFPDVPEGSALFRIVHREIG